MYRLLTLKHRKPLEQMSPDYIRRLRKIHRDAFFEQGRPIDIAKPISENINTESTNEEILNEEDNQNIVESFANTYFNRNNSSPISTALPKPNSSSHEPIYIEEKNEQDDIKIKFARACVDSNLNHQQINNLLTVLREHSCFEDWPKDARTLLQTPHKPANNICDLAGGKYVHFGFREAVLEILCKTPQHLIPEILVIDFSTDGGNRDKQSKVHVWPIQIRVRNIPHCEPAFVGVWCGEPHVLKPTNSPDFFRAFVTEFNHAIVHGITFKKELKLIRFGSFIADAPARSQTLGHMGHNSEAPCSRCKAYRTAINAYGEKKALRTINDDKRTNEEFRKRSDPVHHSVDPCAFANLNGFDIVTNTVFDYMHAVLLGIMKRILNNLVNGKDNLNIRINGAKISQINARLALIKNHCPAEFARKPDNITKLKTMKATEFRLLLLYTGAVAFRGIMNDAIYFHFLILSSAIRLLASPTVNKSEIECAERFLEVFVENAEDLYGHTFLTYNCHVLLHLAEDVSNFGPLDGISAFPYENNMQYFSKTCRKPTDYLQQIVNRRAENDYLKRDNDFSEFSLKPGKKWTSSIPLPLEIESGVQYRSLQLSKLKININDKDNTLMLKNGAVGLVQNIIYINNTYKLVFQQFPVDSKSFFSIGEHSSKFMNIYHFTEKPAKTIVVGIDDIHGKCFRMPYFPDNSIEPIANECIVILIPSTII